MQKSLHECLSHNTQINLVAHKDKNSSSSYLHLFLACGSSIGGNLWAPASSRCHLEHILCGSMSLYALFEILKKKRYTLINYLRQRRVKSLTSVTDMKLVFCYQTLDKNKTLNLSLLDKAIEHEYSITLQRNRFV